MNYKKWIDNFMNAWKEQDVKLVMNTISDDCEYYENVFDEPCKSFDAIVNLWKEFPTNQKDISYSYEIISKNDEFCIINFFVTRTLLPSGIVQSIDGIFQISLNESGKCSFFKQWRSVQNK